MRLASFLRATRHDIRSMLWRFTRPKPDGYLVQLNCRRIKLSASHRSTRKIDALARDYKTSQLRRELGFE